MRTRPLENTYTTSLPRSVSGNRRFEHQLYKTQPGNFDLQKRWRPAAKTNSQRSEAVNQIGIAEDPPSPAGRGTCARFIHKFSRAGLHSHAASRLGHHGPSFTPCMTPLQ